MIRKVLALVTLLVLLLACEGSDFRSERQKDREGPLRKPKEPISVTLAVSTQSKGKSALITVNDNTPVTRRLPYMVTLTMRPNETAVIKAATDGESDIVDCTIRKVHDSQPKARDANITQRHRDGRWVCATSWVVK
jgi:hypothetical protein